MKTLLASSLRTAALAATLLVLPALASANDAGDRATQLLASQGTVAVRNAGPYVELGTLQIQVSTKLGEPAVKLADGSWLYPHFAVGGSGARGTLVVRFTRGSVSGLALVTPAIATAMIKQDKAGGKTLVAEAK